MRGMRLSGLASIFVVLGPSGSGKSSFLRAGLLPRLAREDRRFAVLGVVRPERSALTGKSGLAAAIHSARAEFGLAQPALGDIKDVCVHGGRQLVDLVAEVQQAAMARLSGHSGAEDAPAPPTLVLPLDQAEELFSADAGSEGAQFITLLRWLIEDLNRTEIRLVVVATIRTDSYEVMQTHPGLAGIETVVFDELRPMPATQFKEVIVGPAARATQAGYPLTISPALVDRLLADAGEGAEPLPLLALTLCRLYADYGSTGELTLTQYEAMGGMGRVVQTEIDDILAAEPQSRQRQLGALRAAFIPWLATIDPDTDQPIRRVARYADLPQESRPLIEQFVAKRLMIEDIRGGETVVEVALESLLRQWNELAGWLDSQRSDLKAADALERAAAAWEQHDCSHDWLLTGTRLADAQALAEHPGFRERLATTDRFLAASHFAEDQRLQAEERHRQAELSAAQQLAAAAQERAHHAQQEQATAEAHADQLRRRSRVLRAVLAVTAVIAVIAAVLGITAAINGHAATKRFYEATSVRLNAEARGMLAGTLAGGDVRAFNELLAARTFYNPDDGALYDAVVQRQTTVKIIETPTRIASLAFSPDGASIASAGGDSGDVSIWQVDTGTRRTLGTGDKRLSAVAFSPTGDRIAAGTAEMGNVVFWNAHTGALTEKLRGNEGGVSSIAYSRDGRGLVSGGYDYTLRFWDAENEQPSGPPVQVRPLRTDATIGIQAVAFSPDGRRIAAGCGDDSVRIIDVATGREVVPPLILVPEAGHAGGVTSVAFSPDGHQLVAGSGAGGDFQIWNADTGESIGGPIQGDHLGLGSVAFSRGGHRVVTAGADGTVRLWDTASMQRIGGELVGHQEAVNVVAFSPDGRHIVSGGDDRTIRLWDADLQRPLIAQKAGFNSVVSSADRRRFATTDFDGIARVWDATSGQPVSPPIPTEQKGDIGLAFSPNGHRIITGAGDDQTIRLWDADTGRPIGAPLHCGLVNGIEFSPDGSIVATSGDEGTIRLWAADDSGLRLVKDPLVQQDVRLFAVAFSPDGSRIAVSKWPGDVLLFDSRTGDPVGQALTGHPTPAVQLLFSPDGRRLAAAGVNNTITLWDIGRGTPAARTLNGHRDMVTSVAFSADGHRLVSGDGDGSLRLWDADSGTAIGEGIRAAHADTVIGVAFSADGRRFFSGSHDGTVLSWPAVAAPADLCNKLTTNLNPQQWREWVAPGIPYRASCPGLRPAN